MGSWAPLVTRTNVDHLALCDMPCLRAHDLYEVEVELSESIWFVGDPTFSPFTWAFVEVMGFEPTASTLRMSWLSAFDRLF